MKKNKQLIVAALAMSALTLASCDTYVGQGAGIGAVTGAIVGGAGGHHGHGSVGGALAGAAVGAAAGALVGAAISEADAARYGPPPAHGYVVAHWARPGFVRSPCSGALIDVRGIPPGALVRDPSSGCIFRRP